MYCKSKTIFSSTTEWGFELFNDLQSRLPNLPVFGWLSNKDLEDDGAAGCSKYPDIMDLYYRNKYWQIFEFTDKNQDQSQTLDVTFHLYGAYFDNRTLLPNGPIIRVISMVHSRFGDWNVNMKVQSDISETSPTPYPFVTSGIMTQKLQLSLKRQILSR